MNINENGFDIFTPLQHVRNGRSDLAIAFYRDLLAADPSLWKARSLLASCLVGIGDYEGAKDELLEATRLNPDSATNQYCLGICFEKLGRLNEAIERYVIASKVSTTYAAPRLALGRILQLQGNSADAIREFEEAHQTAPNVDTYIELGNAYMVAGRDEDGIRIYQDWIAIQPEFFRPYFELGRWFNERGRKSEAVEQLSRSMELAEKAASVGSNDFAKAGLAEIRSLLRELASGNN